MFITFEGIDGSGKSTQAMLLAETLRSRGHPVVLTYEPGGTRIGDAVRHLVLDVSVTGGLSERSEALLFAAARAQLVGAVIRPALERGKTVICDRYSDSTIAYQVFGRGLPRDDVERVIEFATGGLKPDLTFLLDVHVDEGLTRRRSRSVDRMEREDTAFHERVRRGYEELATTESFRVVRIDGSAAIEHIAAEVFNHVRARGDERLIR